MEQAMATPGKFGPKDKFEEEIFAVERLRADLQHVIFTVMQESGINRKALADRLACSQSNISQLLSEDGNPTIETIGRVFYALRDELHISSKHFEAAQRRLTLTGVQSWELWVSEYSNHFRQLSQWIDENLTSERPRTKRRQSSVGVVMSALWDNYEQPPMKALSPNRNDDLQMIVTKRIAAA